jgi:glycosyltransferase 2 family protein
MSLHPRIKSFVKFLLFLGIGVLITWLSLKDLSDEHRHELMQSFREANYFWVILVIFIGIGSHIIRALRWNMLLEPIGGAPRLKHTFLAVMIGYFANLAFPRLGEVTRCGVLATTDKIPVNKSFGTVITERGIDMMIFVLLFFMLVSTQYRLLIDYLDQKIFPGLEEKVTSAGNNPLFYLVLAGGAILFTVLILIIRNAKPEQRIRYKIKNTVSGFWNGLISIRHIRLPWLFVLYSLLIWGCYFLMTYLCFRALPETIHLSPMAGFAVLVLGTVGIMVTPGGIGLYPLIARDTLILYGVAGSTGFAMGWIVWGSQTVMIIVTGIIALIWFSLLKRRAGSR